MWLVLRIIIYSRMLGLSLMLMSFYLGQNVLMIVDVLSLLIGILQQVTSFIVLYQMICRFISLLMFWLWFFKDMGTDSLCGFTSWVCNLTSKHHRVDLYCGADGLLCAVFPKRCFGYGR